MSNTEVAITLRVPRQTPPGEKKQPSKAGDSDLFISSTMTERFAPKVAVQLDPPKDDPISPEELAKCDGMPTTRRIATIF